tara:strand:+ start:1387 stop:1857 length:471 start_codon:yes stop_codon:yes gene_type:complete
MALSVVLVGCQSFDTNAPADWVMKGRVVVKTAQSSQRLSVFWRQNQNDFEILLSGTLGTSVARLVSEQGVHYVDLPGKPRQYSDSVESLLFDTTGLNLPVRALLPVLSGEVKDGVFDGWQVSIQAFDEQNRPQRLVVHELALGESIEIRLTVTEWL